MRAIAAHGMQVRPPEGWNVSIFRRDDAEQAPGAISRPILHAATVRMPSSRGDYGSGVVQLLGHDDAFVALLELSDSATDLALFSTVGMPALRPDDLSPTALQRVLPPQAGIQRFFRVGARGMCLYVVVGSYGRRRLTWPRVTGLLDQVEVAP